MKCSIRSCPGEYEQRKIAHTVRHQGQIVVIDDVPAEVCSACGDELLTADTVGHLEQMLRLTRRPVGTVPLYRYG